MNQDKIKALAMELYKNEEVAIELANEIFELRDSEPEKFEISRDFMIKGRDREILELIENRSYRLLELAAYLGGLKEFVEGEENWYIVFLEETREEKSKWGAFCDKFAYSPERVYMTSEVARQVCIKLNSGAYSLNEKEE